MILIRSHSLTGLSRRSARQLLTYVIFQGIHKCVSYDSPGEIMRKELSSHVAVTIQRKYVENKTETVSHKLFEAQC